MMNWGVRYTNGGYGVMGGDGTLAFHYFLGVITWLLVIAVLIALLRILWKKGSK